jgi:hypothetical protein
MLKKKSFWIILIVINITCVCQPVTAGLPAK